MGIAYDRVIHLMRLVINGRYEVGIFNFGVILNFEGILEIVGTMTNDKQGTIWGQRYLKNLRDKYVTYKRIEIGLCLNLCWLLCRVHKLKWFPPCDTNLKEIEKKCYGMSINYVPVLGGREDKGLAKVTGRSMPHFKNAGQGGVGGQVWKIGIFMWHNLWTFPTRELRKMSNQLFLVTII